MITMILAISTAIGMMLIPLTTAFYIYETDKKETDNK
jgi:hypothetical protein